MEIDFDTTHTRLQDVLNVANIDIIIGTASTRGQLDTQVWQSQDDEQLFRFLLIIYDACKRYTEGFWFGVL